MAFTYVRVYANPSTISELAMGLRHSLMDFNNTQGRREGELGDKGGAVDLGICICIVMSFKINLMHLALLIAHYPSRNWP